MTVNRTKDFIERVAWTFLQVEIGLGLLNQLSNGINLSFLHIFYASLGSAAAATVKVLIAQNVGNNSSGDAFPGGVIQQDTGI